MCKKCGYYDGKQVVKVADEKKRLRSKTPVFEEGICQAQKAFFFCPLRRPLFPCYTEFLYAFIRRLEWKKGERAGICGQSELSTQRG